MGQLQASDIVGQLILQLCASPEANIDHLTGELHEQDWMLLGERAQDLRITPLLHRALCRTSPPAAMPKQFWQELCASRDWWTLKSLQQSAGIAKLAQTLADQGFRPVMLKGTPLAFGDYPEAGLRTMRDVDVLLADREEAEKAQDFLLSLGGYRIAPEADAMEDVPFHHLRKMEDTRHELIIEIHHRVSDRPDWDGEAELRRRILENPTRAEIFGTQLHVTARHENLLHLTAHAGIQHYFDNGPQVLADFHYAVSGQPIDWNALLADARALGLIRPLGLIAALARDAGAKWVPGALQGDVFQNDILQAGPHMPAAAAIMLKSAEEWRQDKLLKRLERHSDGEAGWRSALAKSLSPDRRQLAHFAGRPYDSIWRWTGYPAWLFDRCKTYLQAKSMRANAPAPLGERAMRGWLEKNEP